MQRMDLKYKRISDHLMRKTGDEVVLVLPGRGEIKVLNEVGGLIWDMLDGEQTIAAITRRIVDEYTIDVAQAELDVINFVDDLLTRQLVVLNTDLPNTGS